MRCRWSFRDLGAKYFKQKEEPVLRPWAGNELGVLEGRNVRGLVAHVKGREECMGWCWGLDMGALLQGSWYGVCI